LNPSRPLTASKPSRSRTSSNFELSFGIILNENEPFEPPKKHWENIEKFGSCPLRSKTMVFPGFFVCWASSFGFPAYPCTPTPAGAAPGEIIVLCAALAPKKFSVSRLRTLVFPRKTCGFVVEVQDSNYRWDVFKCGDS
jgi:hypothetical protein